MRRDQLRRDSAAVAPFLAAFLSMLTALSVATEAAGSDCESPPASGNWTAATEDATWKDASRDREVPVRIYAPDRKHGNGPYPASRVFPRRRGIARGLHLSRHPLGEERLHRRVS